jgi:DNA-damage-inducible protein J
MQKTAVDLQFAICRNGSVAFVQRLWYDCRRKGVIYMAKTSHISIHTDAETKQAIESLYCGFGITVSDAVNIFFRKSLMEGGLPFEMKRTGYNATTEAAVRDFDKALASGSFKRYSNTEDMFSDILAGDGADV